MSAVSALDGTLNPGVLQAFCCFVITASALMGPPNPGLSQICNWYVRRLKRCLKKEWSSPASLFVGWGRSRCLGHVIGLWSGTTGLSLALGLTVWKSALGFCLMCRNPCTFSSPELAITLSVLCCLRLEEEWVGQYRGYQHCNVRSHLEPTAHQDHCSMEVGLKPALLWAVFC